MESKEKNNIIFIHLETDEDFFKSLEKICENHNLKYEIFLTGVGQLKKFCIGYYNKNEYITKTFNNPHELLHLSGNICKINNNYEFHIHTIVSNKKMESLGGHLLSAKVNITNEIIILKTFIEFSRNLEVSSGLKKLTFDF